MIIKTQADLEKCIKAIKESEIIAVDTETTGLNVRKEKVIGLGIATSENISFYIPTYTYNKGLDNLGTHMSTKYIPEVLELLKSKKLIYWNASFDIRVIKNNLKVNLIDSLYADVMLLKHTVDEIPPFGLKPVAARIFGVDSTTEQKEMKESVKANGGSTNRANYQMFKADMPILAKYCEQDCKLTLKLFNHYLKQLKAEKLESFFFDDEVMPLYRTVTISMEDRGLPIDTLLIKKNLENIKSDIIEVEKEVHSELEFFKVAFEKHYFDKMYPAKKTGKFAQKLIEMKQLPLPRTATGRFSTSKANLIKLADSETRNFFLGTTEIDQNTILWVQKEMHKIEDPSGRSINLSSKDHLKFVVFNILGEKPERFTPREGPVLDDEYLSKLKDKYTFINPLLSNKSIPLTLLLLTVFPKS